MKIELSAFFLMTLAALMLSLLLVESEMAYLSTITLLLILQFFLINDDLLPHHKASHKNLR